MQDTDKFKLVQKNPELFQSLADFDKNGKLTKLYKRKRIDITIDEKILREFKKFCQTNGFTLSRKIENLMLKIMEKPNE